ncbi:Endoplasmic reticulum mannosyl-oligosaccharide 1,2-alpha-mannosidase [Dinochytrium kinnereticum]|nr:Endoplasmic reticulum mannosyl-oligosaccharide 1,2-alpha-mannosidase [Dinochytrium kinnereticum]
MGHDELMPVSKKGNSWLHLGITVFDALDTALLMNQTTVFEEAVAWILKDFTMTADVNANVFETTIRVLGGLLAAYHLSGREELKVKAVEVAEKLVPAFEGGGGLPLTSIHLRSGQAVASPYDVSTSEATSLQLEFKYLAHLTGEVRYWNAVEGVMRLVDGLEKVDGLAPIFMSSVTGGFRGQEISLAEYLAKQYLLTNRTEKGHLRQYREAIHGIKKHLLMRSKPHNLLYVQELPNGVGQSTLSKMDHLSDVRVIPPPKRDQMESFFLGETLKYFYLLFSDDDIVPLDRYVFNTEAHPLPVFSIRPDMKDRLVFVDEVRSS